MAIMPVEYDVSFKTNKRKMDFRAVTHGKLPVRFYKFPVLYIGLDQIRHLSFSSTLTLKLGYTGIIYFWSNLAAAISHLWK